MKKLLLAAAASLALGTGAAFAADFTPPGGTIAYLVTDFFWTTYESPDGKEECPQGFNPWGPREQFKALFPDDGTKRTELETHLAREIAGWFPDTKPDTFPFYEVAGTKSYGMNLDGKIGPNDFTSPDGEKGIDNELYRVIGCVLNLRPPEGPTAYFANRAVMEERWNRVMFELTKVDSLTNDDDIDVTIYRGRDHILMDNTGNNFVPGGSQRLDTKWGKKFTQHMHGRIINGTLITDPIAKAVIPWSSFTLPTVQKFKDMRLKLKLDPQRATGLIAGYVDVENWYMQTVKSESTHHQSYGQSSPPSIYKVLRRRADAYPDENGVNTAISAALETKMVQVYIIHEPGGPVAALSAPMKHAAVTDEAPITIADAK